MASPSQQSPVNNVGVSLLKSRPSVVLNAMVDTMLIKPDLSTSITAQPPRITRRNTSGPANRHVRHASLGGSNISMSMTEPSLSPPSPPRNKHRRCHTTMFDGTLY
eukprot:scaffold2903_cov170-Amphora_coffeaeformis.AAC.12